MKNFLRWLIALAGVVSSVALAQPPAGQALDRLLATPGSDSVAALDEVLAKSASAPALTLYSAAGVALREKRIEDAGYLFYVARFRTVFDRELFPPTGTGGDSPMVLFGALQQQLGPAVNPALLAEPKALARVLARVQAWTADVPADYVPGWTFGAQASREKAEALLQARLKEFHDGMGGICTLLQDETYFAAFRTAQDFNLRTLVKKPTPEAFEAAMQTMARIENERGIQGIATKAKR